MRPPQLVQVSTSRAKLRFISGRAPRLRGIELAAETIRYEVADRIEAISCGGIGAVHQLAHRSGLVRALDTRLPIFKCRRPYSEADPVLNIAYNIVCGGHVLDDIEIRRNDVAFLNALGARTIPDPTTAGDFCRRFSEQDVETLMDILNDVRVGVWKRQPPSFLRADGAHRRGRLDRGDAWRVQARHGPLVQRHLGLPPAPGVARQYRRAAVHQESQWQSALARGPA